MVAGLFSLNSSAGKWLGLVTAVWVQAISGNNYTFANYSNALKTLMALNQLQLNNLSVAKDIGKAFGILAGFASDRLSTPVILLIGSVEGLIGYGVQWLVVSKKIRPLAYWQMCIFLGLGGNSTTWMNTAVLVTCIRNFRKNRGPVSGILKGYVGLSTAIFTDLCSALFSNSPSSFLLMLAIVPAAVCIFSILFLREVDPSVAEDKGEAWYFSAINSISVVIALYLLAYNVSGHHSLVFSRAFSAILLLLMVLPLAVPIYVGWKSLRLRNVTDLEQQQVGNPVPIQEAPVTKPTSVEEEEKASQQEEEKEEVVKKEEGEIKKRPVMGEDHTILQAFRSLDFWILFVSFLCGVGTGMAVMNNMGQMGIALGHSNVSIFVALMSIWGFFGRIGSGTISEYCLKKYATPRPLWNAASQILMAGGYAIMAIALPGSLYMGSIVVGFCYGVRLAVTVPTASELFGLKYFGLIYNILILNLPLGSFLFSGMLAGFLYDSQATHTARRRQHLRWGPLLPACVCDHGVGIHRRICVGCCTCISD
ncbi:protein NUCLEAR FUSION DEFECTIVE 4-like protein [Cinnamomum micranthum f. kanehirae]|uniref:Protein NUCLEAR FUSION DEFECTIVE 4-like protein n=1 Tax=Cinnamomum micranthum f. kanehirae TaxID=337451 RepID=A0A443PXT6_9MAGN|nr:protein NUCLEAR FUSION DEFECTIVE 4-like protein [Cinnamomum micranthum f. kanehirae]